jgi:YggT family protein
MFILNVLFKIYIIVLIFRSIFTSQELYFNPFGKLVASLTEPIFSNFFKGKSKNITDKYIPIIIIFLIFLSFIVNYALSSGNAFNVLFYTIQDYLSFLTVFLIISIILGGGVGVQSYYSLYFYRIGLPWVKIVRKFIPIPDNRIILPSILFLILLYGLITVGLNVMIDFIMIGNVFWVGSLIKFIKSSLYMIDKLLMYLFWLIIIRALISWVSPDPRNPIVQIIYSITEPVLAPFRRIIPPIGFIDISAIIVLVLIEVLRNLLFKIF